MMMKISNRHSSVLKSQMESISELCGRMVLPSGDEGAARCLHAHFRLGQRKAIRETLV